MWREGKTEYAETIGVTENERQRNFAVAPLEGVTLAQIVRLPWLPPGHL
jgi:hypothetical protein